MIDWDKLNKLDDSMSPGERQVLERCLADVIDGNSDLQDDLENHLSQPEADELFFMFKMGWLACRTIFENKSG